ncbi:MAG: glycosyltransferase family 4 protein [Candidatus Omnitrophica bacterium]|nr:glycosyltransferase family 4 protein [Candidatus Omnitrophota bacterium]
MKNPEKKILFIITHLKLGGAQKHLFSLIDHCLASGYTVHLITGRDGFFLQKLIKFPQLKVICIPALVRHINLFNDIASFFTIYFYIKKHTFSLVHTHSPKGSFLGRWAAYASGVKNIVYTVHGWPFHYPMNILTYGFYAFLERISARITRKIIIVSSADLNTALQKKIAPPEKMELIHCGVHVEYCEKIYRHRSPPLKNNPMIITVSALKPQKGLMHFLSMAAYVTETFKNAQFYIIGEGPLRKQLEKRIKNLGLKENVHLIDWHEDLSFFYTHASLFVLSSLWEGLPMALIEAVLSGIPVLVSDTQGIHDIVSQNEQGRIVRLDSLDSLGKVCRELLQNIEYWNIIVSHARKNILRDYWSEQRALREIDSLYSRLCI